jgi:hypothetical protein
MNFRLGIYYRSRKIAKTFGQIFYNPVIKSEPQFREAAVRKIDIYVFMALILLPFSCGDYYYGPLEPEEAPMTIMPLQIGNRWEGIRIAYENSFYPETTIEVLYIDDTVTVDEEQWYIVKKSVGGEEIDPLLMYSNRSNGLWRWSTSPVLLGGKPRLFIKYPARTGERYLLNDRLQIRMIVNSTGSLVETGAGIYETINYETDDPRIDAGIQEYYYVPDIGPIKWGIYRFAYVQYAPVTEWELRNFIPAQ